MVKHRKSRAVIVGALLLCAALIGHAAMIVVNLVSYVHASTQDCQMQSIQANVFGSQSGLLFLNVFGVATDTTYKADTANYPVDTYGAKRIIVEYKCTMMNALCSKQTFPNDSVDYNMNYYRTNDGVTLTLLDSSGTIQDTNLHVDTIAVRGKYTGLVVGANPSRNSHLWDDSTGQGGVIEYSEVYGNSILRLISWKVTVEYYDTEKRRLR